MKLADINIQQAGLMFTLELLALDYWHIWLQMSDHCPLGQLVIVLTEIPVFKTNSVDPDQKPCSVGHE